MADAATGIADPVDRTQNTQQVIQKGGTRAGKVSTDLKIVSLMKRIDLIIKK